MGTQNGHNVPFFESASLEKRKRSVIKQFYKISKKLIKIMIKTKGMYNQVHLVKIGLKKNKIKNKRNKKRI